MIWEATHSSSYLNLLAWSPAKEAIAKPKYIVTTHPLRFICCWQRVTNIPVKDNKFWCVLLKLLHLLFLAVSIICSTSQQRYFEPISVGASFCLTVYNLKSCFSECKAIITILKYCICTRKGHYEVRFLLQLESFNHKAKIIIGV